MGSELGKRDTSLWEYKRYVQGSLTSLLDDLEVAAHSGVTDKQCRAIHESLKKGANLAAGIPDGPFFSIGRAAEQFANQHREWNEVRGSESGALERRRNCMKRLRKTRNKIARRLRKNGSVIDANLDVQRHRAVHQALIRVVQDSPDIFRNLAKAVERISRLLVGP